MITVQGLDTIKRYDVRVELYVGEGDRGWYWTKLKSLPVLRVDQMLDEHASHVDLPLRAERGNVKNKLKCVTVSS